MPETTPDAHTPRILALGLGNILCGDDGFGIHAIERLHEGYAFPDTVRVVDGGTQGQTLYGLVTEARCLLVFDAADFGCEPGTLVTRDSMPIGLGARKLSPHQNSFMEVLALAALSDSLPPERVLIGCQPLQTEFGQSLSDCVRAAIEPAVAQGVKRLCAFGVTARPRARPETLLNAELLNSRFLRG